MTYFTGRVHSVVFENPTKAYYILKMVLDGDKTSLGPLSVKGTISGLTIGVGVWFGFEADWDNHPLYGKQLTITRAPVIQGGWTADTVYQTLTANGVGGLVLTSIRSHFGDDRFLEVLGENDPALLTQVPGINTITAQHLLQRWHSVNTHFRVLGFLADLGLPAGVVRDIWAYFKDDTQTILSTNPWALVEVDGVSFTQADAVATRSNVVDNEKRLRGAILFACKDNRSFGHVYQKTGDLYSTVSGYIGDVTQKSFLEVLVQLHLDKKIVLDKKTRPGLVAVYEPSFYDFEKRAAEMLVQRVQTARFEDEIENHTDNRLDQYLSNLGSVGPKTAASIPPLFGQKGRLLKVAWTALEEWGSQAQLVLSDDQKKGALNGLTAPVSLLTGLPGTGKTTSLKAIVRILQDAGVPYLLCAPTGIAAKNLSSRTGAEASTIHRAFGAKGSSEETREATYAGVVGSFGGANTSSFDEGLWGYGPNNHHPAEVVIVDESSMMDQHLLVRLLECTKPSTRLVFVGDYAQLPSVGPGNVLRDLLDAEVFPSVRLTQIFRQSDTSGIVYAAHSIVKGDMPDQNKDFKFWEVPSEDEVLEKVLQVGLRLYQGRRNFQILSPKHNGTVGVTNLNSRLRELINPAMPGLNEMKVGKDVIREGDRIMIIQNDYKLGVYNGDVGKVSTVDRAKKQLEVKIFGTPILVVSIDFKDVTRLIRLAYACTVHKAQGLEYDIVVMPLVRGFSHQLQRNLLYTAVTRAKKQVVLVGHSSAMQTAVSNSKEDDRATLLQDRLIQGFLSE